MHKQKRPEDPSRREFIRRTTKVLAAAAAPKFLLSLSAEEGAPRKYRPKYKTLAHECLQIEGKDLGTTSADYRLLDGIIDDARKKITVKPTYSRREAVNVLKTISLVLKDRGFIYGDQRLLNQALKTKRIDCDTYSIIYLAIAEVVGLPLVGVKAPEHVFVRWDPDGKHDAVKASSPENKDDFNWETTTARETDDTHYMALFNISEESVAEGVYLKNLSKNEIYASMYLNTGSNWYDKCTPDDDFADYRRKMDKAFAYYTKAIELNPNYYEAYTNRGNVWQCKGKYDKAIADYTKAIELNPNNYKAYSNRGFAWIIKGDVDKARKDFDTAKKLQKQQR